VVPGYQWVAALLASWTVPTDRRPVRLAAWHWYGKPAPTPEPASAPEPAPSADPSPETTLPRQTTWEAQQTVLQTLVARFGADRLLHVWDRGVSGARWLQWCLAHQWHFVVRWKKGNHLRPASAPTIGRTEASATARQKDGEAAWKLTRGKRAWGHGQVPNPRRPSQPITIAVLALPVCLVFDDTPLWLVVARRTSGTSRRRGSEPWRLLTTEPVETVADCWRIVTAYLGRWQIEQHLRFAKTELAVETIRLRSWQARAKLLALVTFAVLVLLELLGDCQGQELATILHFAHRTGRVAKDAWRPLYRLRLALATLWNHYTPNLQVQT